MFEDINHDGLLDFSVKDSLNISLFDPHNYTTIWTSPALDSTYKCYTIGDRNDDGWMDVAIVNQEPTDTTSIYDTVLVNIYNGPDFRSDDGFYVLAANYHYSGPYMNLSVKETIKCITIDKISEDNSYITKLFIFIDYSRSWASHSNYGYRASGSIFIVDNLNFDDSIKIEIGSTIYRCFKNIDEFIRLYTIGSFYLWQLIGSTEYIEKEKRLNSLSAETLLSSIQIWYSYFEPYGPEGSVWRGHLMDDINSDYEEEELCIGIDSSLYLYTFPDPIIIWTKEGIIGILSVYSIYISQTLFNSPQIICQSIVDEYLFFSGTDGSLTSVLPSPGFDISYVCDLDSDGNDELLSIQENSLHIYHLEQYVDINNPEVLPYSTFIQPNYPNPFNASTTIEFGLHNAAHVTIEIFDLLGRKVETLISENQPAGFHQLTWNAGDKPSGIYFYKIQTGEFTKAKKMLLLK